VLSLVVAYKHLHHASQKHAMTVTTVYYQVYYKGYNKGLQGYTYVVLQEPLKAVGVSALQSKSYKRKAIRNAWPPPQSKILLVSSLGNNKDGRTGVRV